MAGWLIGIASLAGLIAVLRRGRRGYGCGRSCGGSCGGSGGGEGRCGRGGGAHGGRWGGPRRALRFLFERLETSPGQEKELLGARPALMAQRGALRDEAARSREEIARALRSEGIDETVLGALFARDDEALRAAQRAFAGALGRVHAALDPEQRVALAELLERGPRFAFGGPYRRCARRA